MNKQEVVNEIARTTGITKKDAAAALDAFCNIVGKAILGGDKVTLTGFGTFEARLRDARDCKNPATGETVHVSAHKVPAFKASKTLKEFLL